MEDILVKDAHDSGRNIFPVELPEQARILRGWAKHPLRMMAGLDETFDGVVFTGYHSAAEMPTNPLSHTMNLRNNHVKLNGELCSELMINSLSAAMMGVPVYCVCGDKGLCEWIQSVNPNIRTVPVSEGHRQRFHLHPSQRRRAAHPRDGARSRAAAPGGLPVPDAEAFPCGNQLPPAL